MYEIKNYRKNTGRGITKGWFTLAINDFAINDMSVVAGEKGDFIGFPQKKYTDKDGNDKYSNIVFILNQDRRYAFQDWALKELEKFNVERVPEGETDDIPF